MCGRYVNARPDSDLVREFGVSVVVAEPPGPSWNIAPTQTARVVLERAPGDKPEDRPRRILRNARWGLVPSWAKDIKIGNRLINARMETITEKPAFKAAARRRRCLVPADGYYEWEKANGATIPYFLHRNDEALAFAGLYELWPNPELAKDDPNRWLWTYTIITTTAPDVLGHVHDRSPVVIPAELRADWLDPELTDPNHVRTLLAAAPPPRLEPYRVSSELNDPRNNGPHLVEPTPRATRARIPEYPMSTAPQIHRDHGHVHGEGCGHVAFQHSDHLDYAHDGHLHRQNQGQWAECEVSEHTPCESHEHQHEHGCGHTSVPHGDHIDYLHDEQRHAAHQGHYDQH